MPVGYGRNILTQWSGVPLDLLADPSSAKWKAGGITIDWTTVAAVTTAPYTTPDGEVIAVGNKVIQIGQVMTRITASGLFGPYDSTASDGRQLRVWGDMYVINRTIIDVPQMGPAIAQNTFMGALEGGLILKPLLLLSTVTQPTGSPAGPTLAQFLAVFGASFEFIQD